MAKLPVDIKLGKIGLGMFPFSGVFRPITQETIEAVTDKYIDLGGRYFETAPVYPKTYDAKKLLSRYNRDDIFVATKCVTGPTKQSDEVTRSGKREHILWQVDEELKRLGCEYIDLLQSHITPPDVTPDEFMQTIEELLSSGKVKNFGMSNVSLEGLKAFNKNGHISWVQNRLSLVHHKAYDPIEDYCAKNGIKLNCYQVVERGQLLDKSAFDNSFDKKDVRSKKTEYTGEENRVVRQWFMDEIMPVAKQFNIHPNQLAVGWALAQSVVGLAVIGATSPQQLDDFFGINQEQLKPALPAIDAAIHNLRQTVQSEFGVTLEEFRGA